MILKWFSTQLWSQNDFQLNKYPLKNAKNHLKHKFFFGTFEIPIWNHWDFPQNRRNFPYESLNFSSNSSNFSSESSKFPFGIVEIPIWSFWNSVWNLRNPTRNCRNSLQNLQNLLRNLRNLEWIRQNWWSFFRSLVPLLWSSAVLSSSRWFIMKLRIWNKKRKSKWKFFKIPRTVFGKNWRKFCREFPKQKQNDKMVKVTKISFSKINFRFLSPMRMNFKWRF